LLEIDLTFLIDLSCYYFILLYLKQAMRQPIYQIPERMYLFGESDYYLWLPRGLLDPLQDKFKQVVVEDRRKVQRSIRVAFKGEFTLEQELALSDMNSKENGLLHAGQVLGRPF
ncbi:TPA: DNA primase, partial [Streptococcus pneumoniae]